MALAAAEGTNGRGCPGCPGWAPGLRLLLCLRPRGLCSPASPSEEGGLEELVEFFFRPASCRSRSAICFSASAICFSRSAICCSRSAICCSRSATLRRSPSFSRSSRSFSRCSCSRLGWLECRWPFAAASGWFARRAALALIHHKVNDSARFVQQNRQRYLNCYKNFTSEDQKLGGLSLAGKNNQSIGGEETMFNKEKLVRPISVHSRQLRRRVRRKCARPIVPIQPCKPSGLLCDRHQLWRQRN